MPPLSLNWHAAISRGLVIVSDEVRQALATRTPVVALESTVITHGLPAPQNLSTAQLLEATVRKEGGVPATIGLLDGHIHIGLSSKQLTRLADTKSGAVKVSARDLPNALATGLSAGTTVAATIKIAHAAGIRIFSTGGIGGVHRNVHDTFDISADLVELGRTPVAVVSAGAKSILDIPKTLEYLETQGCNVIVYGKDRRFPGFFTPQTPYLAPFSSTSLQRIAEILASTDDLGLRQGTLIAVPLEEAHAGPAGEIEAIIEQAVQDAADKGIASKEVTPYILGEVNRLSNGKSVDINIALLENNAKVATKLAKFYVNCTGDKPPGQGSSIHFMGFTLPNAKTSDNQKPEKKPKVVCVGGAFVDFEVVSQDDVKNDGATYEGQIFQRCGGVARNHAEALGRLGCESTLLTAIGSDDHADYLRSKATGIYDLNRAHILDNGLSTATCMNVNVRGVIQNAFFSIRDIMNAVSPDYLVANEESFANADAVVLDANLTPPALTTAVQLAQRYGKKVWFDPTDLTSATKILDNASHLHVTAMSPNASEAAKLCEAFGTQPTDMNAVHRHFYEACDSFIATDLPGEAQLAKQLFAQNPFFEYLFITFGHLGTIAFRRALNIVDEIEAFRFAPPLQEGDAVISASGAGDCFNSGFISARLHNQTFFDAVRFGLACARQSLLSNDAVPTSLSELTVAKASKYGFVEEKFAGRLV